MKRASTPSLPLATARPDGSEGLHEHRHRRRTRSEEQRSRDRSRGDRALEKRRARFLESLPIVDITPDGFLVPFFGTAPGRLRFESVDAIGKAFGTPIVLRKERVPKLSEVLAALSLASKRIPVSCFTTPELRAYAFFSWLYAWRFAQTVRQAHAMPRRDGSIWLVRMLREFFGWCASNPDAFLQWFGKLATARFSLEPFYPDEVRRVAEDLSQYAAAVYGHLADCGQLAPARAPDTIEACFVAEATRYNRSTNGEKAHDAIIADLESFRKGSAKYSTKFAELRSLGGLGLTELLAAQNLWDRDAARRRLIELARASRAEWDEKRTTDVPDLVSR